MTQHIYAPVGIDEDGKPFKIEGVRIGAQGVIDIELNDFPTKKKGAK